jgi:hypothetical protein
VADCYVAHLAAGKERVSPYEGSGKFENMYSREDVALLETYCGTFGARQPPHLFVDFHGFFHTRLKVSML